MRYEHPDDPTSDAPESPLDLAEAGLSIEAGASAWANVEACLWSAPPDRADRPYMRRDAAPAAWLRSRIHPRVLLPSGPACPAPDHAAGVPPVSDLLVGGLYSSNRTESARATVIEYAHDAIDSLDTAACDDRGAIGFWVKSRPDPTGTSSPRVFWALTNASTAQAVLHDIIADEERRQGPAPVADAYRAIPDAAEIFRAMCAARRIAFPAEELPRAMAGKLGRVPGARTPMAWAALAIAAGIEEPIDPREDNAHGREVARRRADVWRKRLEAAGAELERRQAGRLGRAIREAVCE
jgi:hypothetical protein